MDAVQLILSKGFENLLRKDSAESWEEESYSFKIEFLVFLVKNVICSFLVQHSK